MIRTMLGVAIAAAVLTGCASKTQNNSPTAPAASSAAQPSVAASPAAATRAAASPSSGSLAFPAATAAVTAAPESNSTPEIAATAAAAQSAPTEEPRAQPSASPGNGSVPSAAAPTTAAPAATQSSSSAPSKQTAPAASAPGAVAGAAATAAPATGPAVSQVPAVDARELIDNVKLNAADLPAGYGLGGLQGYQTSEMAVNGFADPAAVRAQMIRTGRTDGYIEQITTPESSNGAGVSVEVWQDATGAKAYFDNYPRPSSDVDYQQIDVPGLGDQVFAYRYTINGQTGYSIAWRRGRIILGVGEMVGNASDGLEKVLAVARLVDQKAQAAAQ
jgi:hypothetical protein